ncbi:MAG: HTH-type transcriptional activator IlvY [Desulfuromonadaceae bacterium]|nr:HTH-type transcriptional activator IlvY [Desulfuromonadaceae bacterium]
MDTRELELFLTVAELLHFGRASQQCHVSPSALTRTIQKLEQEVGQSLFVRDNRSVQLSAAGEQFRQYARQALQQWRDFHGTLMQDPVLSGSLTIYASITAVYSLLPSLLEDYRQRYPAVQLTLHSGAAEQAVARAEQGEIDLAVAARPERLAPGMAFLPLAAIPLIFIAPREMVLEAEANPLDLSRVPLVMPHRGLARRRLQRWLKKNRVVPDVRLEVSGNEALIAMVRLGCGVGVVPELVWQRSPFREEVKVVTNAPRLTPYVVGLYASRKSLLRNPVQALWQLAEERLDGA